MALSDEACRWLDRHRVGRLATVDPAGTPHVVPICFAVLEGTIYMAIDEKPKRGDPKMLRRVRNIQANPAVCLVVDDYDEDWSKLAWLQVRGEAALVEDDEERARAIAALRQKYEQYRPMKLEALPMVRIVPARVVRWSAAPSA